VPAGCGTLHTYDDNIYIKGLKGPSKITYWRTGCISEGACFALLGGLEIETR